MQIAPVRSIRVPLVVHGVEGLVDLLDTEVGVSDWVTVEQDKINVFADLTNDAQWIHVDPNRAADGPFGAPVQHGFLTLALATSLLDEIVLVEGASLVLNYGVNRVRFPAPARVGSRLRMHARVAEIEHIVGGVQVVYRLEYEIKDQAKPCCVAELVFRYYI